MLFKRLIKTILQNIDIWDFVTFVRSLPQMLHWIKTGCSGFAPHPIKIIVINSYLRKYELRNFVETGTYLGDTLENIAKKQITCTSIELSDELYKAACGRFKSYKNVKLLNGDSGIELPKLINLIDKPTLFWLDGHYSHGITACADIETPISTELRAILSHNVKNHVILIDDARCFNGDNGYPELDELLLTIREDNYYNVEVSTDIIRITPKGK